MRGVLFTITCIFLSFVAHAQESSERIANHSDPANTNGDFAEVVVPITSLRLKPSFGMVLGGQGGHKIPTLKPKPKMNLDAIFGTGFCLDAACSYIATNYHVALAEPDKVQNQKIVQRYLATGPDDKEATANTLPNSDVIAYSKKRDLAILELEHPLRQHHGLSFKLDEMEIGEEVDIYGYPKGPIDPRRKLTRFPARFKAPTTSGLLAFTYEPFTDTPIRVAGASGGIVVDRKTQEIVAILSESNETTAAAVPVQNLAEFVVKVLPFLAQKMFPEVKQIPPISTDLYPTFIPLRSTRLQTRPEEPPDVRRLRQNAQGLADSIRNFIAVQSYAWGTGDREPDAKAAYEVRVIDGNQWFRHYPEGTKEFPSDDVPPPNRKAWVLPADEWSKLPKMIGTEFKLKIQRAPDAVVNQQRMNVFQYYASAEDNLCPFQPVEDWGFFTTGKIISVPCYGEAWTDENQNILRISKRLDLSDNLRAYRGWKDLGVVITYGALDRPDEPVKVVPRTIFTEVRDQGQSYWCQGSFTDYRVFSVGARIVTESAAN